MSTLEVASEYYKEDGTKYRRRGSTNSIESEGHPSIFDR